MYIASFILSFLFSDIPDLLSLLVFPLFFPPYSFPSCFCSTSMQYLVLSTIHIVYKHITLDFYT